ncbi:sigma-54-dependent transcriptional regulator [Paraliomyxa miuraensis]|uniref:sigma-54-dependent transcriptional regulator n=1 Tax=Paraliomyxa miuraensis TaxID=376150 RepID=UPI00224DDF0F|nr:sigma-54 dependent transcriptional regulator [Paraliomyxa miuraensis]MCX4242359.1 sigma-54 dependent transcriptional regulator [Paraliomyxa miuraensis]
MTPLRVVVAAGPDLGRHVVVDGDVTVGRGATERLQLTDSAVSRHHLTLRPGLDAAGRPAVLVAEIAGVNPVWTLVEGHRADVLAGHALGEGTTVTLGGTTLRIEAAPAATRTPGRGTGGSTVEIDARLSERPDGSERLASLAALGDRLARCDGLHAVFKEASTWAIGALPATRAMLLSPDGRDILGAAADGAMGDLALSRTLLRRVLDERRAFLVRDVLAEPDLADRRSVQLRGIVGAMAAPAQNLVFYVDWGPSEALARAHDEDALLLLCCAAHLVSALGDNASERSQLHAAARRGPGSAGRPSLPRMIGQSAAMKRLQVFIERVAGSSATVLLRGESGTGKELAAGLVHGLSTVARGPFVAINCAAIPEQLQESELFGHEKGAFTGAVSQHDGVFARADGGTLFLDEIGEMSPSTQARMLRVLETRRFTRVGGTKEVQVSVRLVAATHRDLRQMVADGQFREDLLYRLSVIHTELPPLRERPDDIELLVRHFTTALGGEIGRRIERIAPDALDALARYRWPGNVRELRNVVERALVLGDGPVLELDDLPPELLHAAPSRPAAAPTAARVPEQVRTLAELERDAIAAALHATGGNKARAAALLGIDRTTLYRKLKDYQF